MKRTHLLKIQARAFKQVMEVTPVSGGLSLVCKGVEGLFPAYVTSILALLYTSVADYLKGQQELSAVYQWGALLLLGHVVNQLFMYLSSITINAAVYEKANQYAKIKLYEKSARLPLIAYEHAGIMDSKRRAEECANREILSQLFLLNVTMLINAVSVISVVAILSSYHWLFLPISFLSVLPYGIARVLRGREFYHLKHQQVKKERRKNDLWSLLTQKRSIKEMRVMGFQQYLADKWINVRDEVNEETWALVKKDAYSLLICDVIRSIGYGLSLVLAFGLAMNQLITLGVLGACISAFASVQGQTKVFLVELGNLPEKINYAKDYFSFLDTEEEQDTSIQPVDYLGNIQLQGISFRYPNASNDAVRALSMTIKQGETLVIVGENGSGKTTLTKLLLGIYPPSAGEIMVNGTGLHHLNRGRYLSKASMVSQQFVAYHMSLRENVALSDQAGVQDDKRITHALADAGLPFPSGHIALDTLLGTDFGGVELSGGQWQKLAIARGIFRDSELVVMDEPTSALDPMIEADILHKFMTLAEGKTTIIVSHRTGLCTRADRIAVMSKGELVELGTHAELMDQAGTYAKLFNAQRQWYV